MADHSSSVGTAPKILGLVPMDDTTSSDSDQHIWNTQLSPPQSLKIALEEAAQNKKGSGVNTPESEEDYDRLSFAPGTVVRGGKGGGFDGKVPIVPDSDDEVGKVYEQLKTAPGTSQTRRPTNLRLKSIPYKVKKGHYYVLADDLELKEILKMGVERENNPSPPKRRKKFSDLVFTRQFTAFDRQNLESADSPFHGFFTLFWLGTAIFVIQLAAKNYQAHGHILGTNEIMKTMLHRDLLVLAVSDGVLCASTGFGWALQKMILAGYISWNKQGWLIQTVWQLFYTFAFLSWTLFREWPWTHTVFFVLHGLIMLMKQHSFAFYNGYLSEANKMRALLQRKLKQLDNTAPVQTPSATTPAASALSTGYLDERPTAIELNQRRKHGQTPPTADGTSEISQIAEAIESGAPLDAEQVEVFKRIMKWEIDALSEDLKGKSSRSESYYPNNLTFSNHYEFISLPTLVYELEYPRSETINWFYVLEKAAATFGVLFIMMLVSQAFIYPVVVSTVAMKDSGVPLYERLEAFPWILSDLIFPFMMEYMMAWYIIWECILNLVAELTYFADRGFYADWWNSVSWDQFARDWNRPVHNFLLRHVYHSSISFFSVNKNTATLITFFLSACVHELVMWCLFKKLRGYLLFLQMSQLPLVQLSRSRWLKGRATLGNLIFWIGIFTGPSLLCSLYLIL